ncbi:hypothetical protein CTAYLR_001807 [Chrysophaeum taylorii]|uniref:Serine racemase n=1 Tax=Chrysophaeum taylorii TaxID=2483200 RepID=A0AAD7XHX4_9STRA|nr:hypothetical protein CTAYLR_001807 [Chrysophaeum taylorii]
MSRSLPVLFEDIARAATRIRGGVVKTNLSHSHWLSQICGCEVYLKHEQTMFTGSFKERGARNALMCLTEAQKREGVVAASAGNHALALSWHGKQLGIPVSVLMPTVAPLAKREKCRAFDANIVVHGANIGEAKAFAESSPEFSKMSYVNGYDDVPIIAGAGTLGLELVDQLTDFDFVMVPCGGAGLLAGVSLAVKTLRPKTRVVGVEPAACASFTEALSAGKPVAAATTSTLADGLAVPTVGGNAFVVAKEYTDDVVIVEEREVALSVLRLLEHEKIVVEGGGATGLAPILPGGQYHDIVRGSKVVVPLCGGNIDTTTLGRVLDRGLAADERLVRFVAEVSDRSGGLHGLTTILKDVGASVKDVFHERAWLHSAVDRVQIKIIIETTGPDHAKQVKQALIDSGVSLLVYQREVFGGAADSRRLADANKGPAEPAPFE